MAAGTVASLHRWPVKSMAGEEVQALAVDRHGSPGDRTYSLFDVFKGEPRRITARETPRLLAWTACYPGARDVALGRRSPPRPAVRPPGGDFLHWEDPQLPGALAGDLGRPVTLHRDPDGQQDRPRTLLLTTAASLRAVETALGAAIDLRRFRPNLHLDLDAEPYAEEAWVGRRLRVGDAELEVMGGCVRCVIPTRDPDTQAKWPQLLRWLSAERATTFGVIVRATAVAIVRPGDPVTLLERDPRS